MDAEGRQRWVAVYLNIVRRIAAEPAIRDENKIRDIIERVNGFETGYTRDIKETGKMDR
jgi:hypothetical protein